MKKSIFALGLMFAALTLTNCTKNEEENIVPETKGQAFELFANADTRTTNDGMSTKWAADDALNVFHAVAGTADYKDDGSFSIAETDLASGRFTGALSGALEDGATYDWYLFYPYKSQITTPANTSGYTQIGQRSDRTQTQTDKDNMAHVEGSNYPLYGQATVEKGEAVNVTMQHIASLIAVNVTNNAAEDIKVSKISFVAPKKIVGAYYIDFSGKSIIYKEHTTASFTSETATLEVTGDATIAAGQSAKFYLGIKPFTAAAGETLTITVSTDKGDCVKTLELKTATTFTAGKIKTLNFGFALPVLPSVSTENPYTVGFESAEGFDAGSTYNNKDIKYSGSDNRQWGTFYGTPSTTDAILDSQSMQMRYYKDNSDLGYTFTNFTLSIVKNIAFKAFATNGLNVKLSYKLKGTGNWTDVQTFVLTAGKKDYEYSFEQALVDAQFKFSISLPDTKPITTSRVIIDDVTFYKNGIVKSLKTPTIESATMTATTLAATWVGDDNATKYEWELYAGEKISDNSDNLVGTGSVKTNSLSENLENNANFLVDKFTEGTKYVLYVKSVGDENYADSEASKEISFKVETPEPEIDYVVLPFSFNDNGTALAKIVGVTIDGVGDYGTVDAKIALKAAGNKFTIKYNTAATSLSFNTNQNGSRGTSVITVSGSTDGIGFTTIQTIKCNEGQNKKTLRNISAIDSTYRYIQISLTTKGDNIGIGKIDLK